jgi:hypothetical protein
MAEEDGDGSPPDAKRARLSGGDAEAGGSEGGERAPKAEASGAADGAPAAAAADDAGADAPAGAAGAADADARRRERGTDAEAGPSGAPPSAPTEADKRYERENWLAQQARSLDVVAQRMRSSASRRVHSHGGCAPPAWQEADGELRFLVIQNDRVEQHLIWCVPRHARVLRVRSRTLARGAALRTWAGARARGGVACRVGAAGAALAARSWRWRRVHARELP